MNSNEFEQTALFQTNLMLWLVWSTPYTGIRPLFREHGFELVGIGHPLPLDTALKTALHASEITVKAVVCPDLLLRNEVEQIFIPIECKKRSFSSTSTDCEQAYPLLCQTGEDIARIVGMPSPSVWDTNVHYVVEHGYELMMLDTLRELCGVLRNHRVNPAAIGSIGIRVNMGDGIYLEFRVDDGQFSRFAPDGELIKVRHLEVGENPKPLYLLPVDMSDGGITDDGLTELENRIRMAFTVCLMRQIHNGEFQVHEADIMRVAIDVWDTWKEEHLKRGLLRQGVRPYLRKVIAQFRRRGATVTIRDRIITFSGVTPEVSRRIRKYIESKKFRTGAIQLTDLETNDLPRTMPMFGDDDY